MRFCRRAMGTLFFGPSLFLLFCILLCQNRALGSSSLFDQLIVAAFSTLPEGGPLPEGWKVLISKSNKRPTVYTLVRDGATVVVKATSSAQSSGLIRTLSVDPKEYPIIQWRWKVSNVLEKSDAGRKEGDDYSARLFLLFPSVVKRGSPLEWFKYRAARVFFGQFGLLRAINYVWENPHPRGTIMHGPYYGDRVRTVVMRNREGPFDTWVTEERNFYQDYKETFQEEPPRLAAVAIMTDTDNTGESVTAYYGDIALKKRPSENSS